MNLVAAGVAASLTQGAGRWVTLLVFALANMAVVAGAIGMAIAFSPFKGMEEATAGSTG
jgi:hypothetical protein